MTSFVSFLYFSLIITNPFDHQSIHVWVWVKTYVTIVGVIAILSLTLFRLTNGCRLSYAGNCIFGGPKNDLKHRVHIKRLG